MSTETQQTMDPETGRPISDGKEFEMSDALAARRDAVIADGKEDGPATEAYAQPPASEPEAEASTEAPAAPEAPEAPTEAATEAPQITVDDVPQDVRLEFQRQVLQRLFGDKATFDAFQAVRAGKARIVAAETPAPESEPAEPDLADMDPVDKLEYLTREFKALKGELAAAKGGVAEVKTAEQRRAQAEAAARKADAEAKWSAVEREVKSKFPDVSWAEVCDRYAKNPKKSLADHAAAVDAELEQAVLKRAEKKGLRVATPPPVVRGAPRTAPEKAPDGPAWGDIDLSADDAFQQGAAKITRLYRNQRAG